MKTIRKKKRLRKRICRNCEEYYLPDYRNIYHQHYCNKSACRLASKKASQQKWLSSSKGSGYFQGSSNVAHVQQWRKTHPGYWKRKRSTSQSALQDDCFSQRTINQSDRDDLRNTALQDICSSQLPLLLGVISVLTGTTLQDEIARTTYRFIDLGYDIMGKPQKKGRQSNDNKTNNLS